MRADRGSAPVEFVVVVVGMLLPLAVLVQMLAMTAAAHLATVQAASEAARAFSTAATPAGGRLTAERAARLAFTDHGVDWPADALRIRCLGACLAPGSAVSVTIRWSTSWRIPLSATAQVPIDDFRDDPS